MFARAVLLARIGGGASLRRGRGDARRAAALPRGAGAALSSVRVELNYQEPDEKLATGRYINQPDRGDVVDVHQAREVDMYDARALKTPATLDAMGFSLATHPSAVVDMRDDAEVVSTYYSEIRELVKRESGASRVFVFDHTIRETGQTNLNAASGGAAAPVPRVHCDYTAEGAPRRLLQLGAEGIHSHIKQRDLTIEEVEALAAGRFAFINVWRSIDDEHPVSQSPLAVCDESSIGEDDKFKYELRFPDRTGENYSLKHSEKHRWYYYPQMLKHECLLFKVFEKELDGRPRFVFHTAFDDPATTDASPPRKSIEVRTIAFYTKPVFFDMAHSNNAARVRLWLQLVGDEISGKIDRRVIGYEDLQTPEYEAINPLKKMPALIRDDGANVFEAGVILKYLEDKYANNEAMTPSTPEARQAMDLMIRIHDLYVASPNCTADGFCHSQGAMYLSEAFHGPRRAVSVADREAKIAELHKQLTWLDEHAAAPFLLGDDPCLADLTWFPTCTFMEFMLPRTFGWPDPFDPAVSAYPALAKWYQHCLSLPAFAETRAEIWAYWEDMESKGQFAPIERELAANPDRKWRYP